MDYVAGDRDKPKNGSMLALKWDGSIIGQMQVLLIDGVALILFRGSSICRFQKGWDWGLGTFSEFNTYQRALETMRQYREWGLKGKNRFFCQNTLSENPRGCVIMKILKKVYK